MDATALIHWLMSEPWVPTDAKERLAELSTPKPPEVTAN